MNILENIINIGNIIIFLLMSYVDIKEHRIPDKLNLLLLLLNIIFLGIGFFVTRELNTIIERSVCFFASGITFITIAIISKGAIGGGDIKLFSILGLIFELKKYVLMIFLTFLLAGIYSITMCLLRKIDRKTQIPMAPFIALSSIIVIYYGEIILQLYVKFMMNLVYV